SVAALPASAIVVRAAAIPSEYCRSTLISLGVGVILGQAVKPGLLGHHAASPSLRGIAGVGTPIARGVGEEVGEDRGEGLWFDDVGLAWQGPVAGAGQGPGEGPRGILQPRGTLAACDDERRGGERGPPAGQQGAALLAAIHDRQVVREGVRDS